MTCLYRSCNICGGTPCVELSGVSYAQCRTCYDKYVAEQVDEFKGWNFHSYEAGSGDYDRPDRHYVYGVKKFKYGNTTIVGQGSNAEAALEDCKQNIRKHKI